MFCIKMKYLNLITFFLCLLVFEGNFIHGGCPIYSLFCFLCGLVFGYWFSACFFWSLVSWSCFLLSWLLFVLVWSRVLVCSCPGCLWILVYVYGMQYLPIFCAIRCVLCWCCEPGWFGSSQPLLLWRWVQCWSGDFPLRLADCCSVMSPSF